MTGLAWPFLLVGPVLVAIGFGLYYTVDQATSLGRMAGYQILLGIGHGFVAQLPVK